MEGKQYKTLINQCKGHSITMKKIIFKCLVSVLVLCGYTQAMYSTAHGINSKMAEISQTDGELSFYFAGYNDLAKPEHGKILVSAILRKTTVEKKTDRNGKTYDDTKFDDQVIGAGTLNEGFHIKIKDPKSDQYEVIIKVKDDRLLAGLANAVTGSTKVGDAYVKDLTINLQKTMYITAHEIVATKSANNRGVITYSFAVKAAEPATVNVAESKVENAPDIPKTPVTESQSAPIPDISMSGCKTFALAGHVEKVTYSNGDYMIFDRNGNLTEEKKGDNISQQQYENFEFDQLGRIKSKADQEQYRYRLKINYIYRGSEFLPYQVETQFGNEVEEFVRTETYTYTETDSQGNWLKCTVQIKQEGSYTDFDTDTEKKYNDTSSKQLTRTVTYHSGETAPARTNVAAPEKVKEETPGIPVQTTAQPSDRFDGKIEGTFEYRQYGGVATLTFHEDRSITFINMFNTVNATLAYESQKAKDPKTGKEVFFLGYKNSDGSWENITNTFLYDGGDEIVLSTGEIYRRKQPNQTQNSKAAEILKTTKCTEALGWFDGTLTVRLDQKAKSKVNTVRITDSNLSQTIQEVNVVDGQSIVTLPVPAEKQLKDWKDTKLLYLQASSLTVVPADLRLAEFSLKSYVPADYKTYSVSVQNLTVVFLYADRDASIYGRLPGGGGYRTYDICLKKGWNTVIYRTGTMEDTTKTEPLPADVVWIIR